MKENKNLIKETPLFKIFASKLALHSTMFHDLLPLSNNRALLTTLSMPLSQQLHPAYLFEFPSMQLQALPEGFIHARNLVENHFTSSFTKDLIVFDHGFDQSPFVGARPKYFKNNEGKYFLDLSTLSYPESFNFNGFSGDWDGDGKKELFICNLSEAGDKLLALNSSNQFMGADDRLPEFIVKHFFKVLSGCAYRDLKQRLHMVLGSSGLEQKTKSDLVLVNNHQGSFTNKDLLWLPERRGGSDWSVIDLKTDNGKILSNAHDAKTQHGVIDLYVEKEHLQFSHYNHEEALYTEKDCWFSRAGFAPLTTSSSEDIIAIKSRGLNQFVPKELNIVFLQKEKQQYIDRSEEFLCLAHKEFIGYMTIEKPNAPSDLLFMEHSGDFYYCEHK